MTTLILDKHIPGTGSFSTKIVEIDGSLNWPLNKVIDFEDFYYEVREINGSTIRATDGGVDQAILEATYLGK